MASGLVWPTGITVDPRWFQMNVLFIAQISSANFVAKKQPKNTLDFQACSLLQELQPNKELISHKPALTLLTETLPGPTKVVFRLTREHSCIKSQILSGS